MSQENVEIVRAMLDAFHRGEFETSLAFLDEGVEWIDPPEVPGAGVHHGPEEVRKWFVRWLAAWDSYVAEAEEVIDAGDQVVVVNYERGRGKGSGVVVENRSANLFDLRDGKVIRKRPFRGRSEALEASRMRGGDGG
jgi:ketosteroid isomerase-like protein